ncbi:hypothetical protein DSECCO2_460130 [anaerobic digester metagenome]
MRGGTAGLPIRTSVAAAPICAVLSPSAAISAGIESSPIRARASATHHRCRSSARARARTRGSTASAPRSAMAPTARPRTPASSLPRSSMSDSIGRSSLPAATGAGSSSSGSSSAIPGEEASSSNSRICMSSSSLREPGYGAGRSSEASDGGSSGREKSGKTPSASAPSAGTGASISSGEAKSTGGSAGEGAAAVPSGETRTSNRWRASGTFSSLTRTLVLSSAGTCPSRGASTDTPATRGFGSSSSSLSSTSLFIQCLISEEPFGPKSPGRATMGHTDSIAGIPGIPAPDRRRRHMIPKIAQIR